MKRHLNKERGITIVSLIVTVITLLILAGVSLVMFNGDNMIDKTFDSKIYTELNQLSEKIEKVKLSEEGERIANSIYTNTVNSQDLQTNGVTKVIKVNDPDITIGVIDLKSLNVDSTIGNNYKNLESSEQINKITDLSDVFFVEMETGNVYYINEKIYSLQGNVLPEDIKSNTQVATDKPSITINANTTNGEGKIQLKISASKNEENANLTSDNEYEYYISTSATKIQGGEWKTYTSGQQIEETRKGNNTYYVFVKTIKDEKGNESEGNTIVNGVKYHRSEECVVTNGITLAINPNGGTFRGSQSVYTILGNKGETTGEIENAEGSKYTIEYNGNGGTTPETQTVSRIFSNWTLKGEGTLRNKRFTFGNGSATLTAKYSETSEEVRLQTSERTGYTLKGWFTEATEGTKVGDAGDTYRPTKDLLLYAQWDVNKYNVTLTPGTEGTLPGKNKGETETIEVTYGTTYGTLPEPTKTGCEFIGWFTQAIGGDEVTADTPVNIEADQTLYAHWEGAKYELTLDPGAEGTLPNKNKGETETEQVEYGSPYGTLPEATRDGYTFDGWYTQETGGTKVTVETEVTTPSNHTIFAHWTANTYTVTLTPGAEGTLPGKNKGETDTIEVTYDSTYGTLPTPTREGYSFEGWFTQANGGDPITSSTPVTITSNQTIHAHWTANTYTVKFNSNGGTGSIEDQSFTFDVTQGLRANTFTRDGYTFAGWNTKTDGTGQGYTNEEQVSNLTAENNGIVNLYAQWTGNPYNITYDYNGGVNASEIMGKWDARSTQNTATTLKDLSGKNRDGTILSNAKLENDHLQINGNSSSGVILSIMNSNYMTLEATFSVDRLTNKTQYVITNVQDGGIGIWVGSNNKIGGIIHIGGSYQGISSEIIPEIGKKYHVILSYDGETIKLFVNGECEVETNKPGIIKSPAGSTRMALGGNPLGNKINQEYFNGKIYSAAVYSHTNATKQVTQGAKVGELPIPTREGYTFEGWYINDTKIESTSTFENAADARLVAHWTPNTYTIKYNADAGTTGSMNDTVVTFDNEINLPVKQFTKDDYTYFEWNTLADATGIRYNNEENILNLTAENNGIVNLYAKFGWTMTYNLNGGTLQTSNPRFYDREMLPITLNNPTKTGNDFIGWTGSNGETSNPALTIPQGTTGDLNYIANFNPHKLYIQLSANEGTLAEQHSNEIAINNEGLITRNNSTILHTINYGSTLTSYGLSDYNSESLINIIKPGYTINDDAVWNTAPDGSGTSYNQTASYAATTFAPNLVDGDVSITLYANWVPITYTVNFDKNGEDATGEIASQAFTYNVSQNLNENTFAREHYTFKGWNTASDGSGASYTDKESVSNLTTENNGTVTLYAQWEGEKHNVTLNPGAEGTLPGKNKGETDTVQAEYGSTYGTLPAPTRVGYTFAGWFTQEEDGNQITDSTPVTTLEAEQVYAHWTANTYQVSFKKNDLPDEYQEVEYIESTGTQYINTNYNPKTTTKMELELSFNGTFQSLNDTGRGNSIVYSADSNYNSFSINFGAANTQNNQLYPWFNKQYQDGGTNVNFSITDEIRTNRNTLTVDPQNRSLTYGTVSKVIPIKQEDNSTPMYLFGVNTLPFGSYNMRVYKLILSENGEIKRNMIPCYRISDNAIGLYDTVDGVFYTNLGTGTFNKGNNTATGTMQNQQFTYDVAQNLTTNAYSREGYTFAGWNTKLDGTGQSYTNEEQVSNLTTENNGIVNLYAQWIDQNGPEITVTTSATEYGAYPETLTITATDVASNIANITIVGTTYTPETAGQTFTKTFDAIKNGPITITATDSSGNTSTTTYNVQNIREFITEWTVPANTTVTLPIYETNPDIYVLWGDEATNADGQFITTTNPTHTYTTAGSYEIKITGTLPKWNFTQGGEGSTYYTTVGNINNKYVTGIKQWGILGSTSMEDAFYGCENITGTIPSPHTKSFENVTSFQGTFRGCDSLTGSIPANLFATSINATTFQETFRGCSGLTGNIPANLFATNTEVKSFSSTFYECSSLTGSIPTSLFANNTKAKSFYATFFNCSGLTGNIPESLFATNTNVTTFQYTFRGCTRLTGSIPANLFANNTKATTFRGTFNECDGLTGSIPADLFATNTEVTTFQGTFYGCDNLTGSIPETLFASNTKVTSFHLTFSYCNSLTGTIPANLFATNTEVTSFLGTFHQCRSLTGNIPAELFANNIKAEIFGNEENINQGTFAYCTGLTTVPQGLFVNNTAMTAVDGVFRGCTGLTSAYVDSKIVGNEMYTGCNNLTSITVANNVTSIGNQAFNYTGSNPPLNTYLTTENNLARNYNWATDNRAIVVGVSFNNNGGTGEMANQRFTSGVAQALTTNTFTRTGYTFTGWNTAADGTGTSYTDGQSITITDSIVLYAQWEDQTAPEITVTTSATEYGVYPETLTITSTDGASNIANITIGGTTHTPETAGQTFTKTFDAIKNGPITITATDSSGNTSTTTYNVQNIREFITEWTVPANTTVTLPIYETNPDIYVLWGDEATNADGQFITTTNPTHTYTTAGSYDIKITGSLPKWNFTQGGKETSYYTTVGDTNNNYVTKIKQWGILGSTTMEDAFYGCENITGTIPSPYTKSFENVTSFQSTFEGCDSLTGSIPVSLFANSTNATSFYYTFKGCNGLTGSIPTNLFANNTEATTFRGTFYECSGLTGNIPASLFANNTKSRTFTTTFYRCQGLTGSIPENLFANNNEVIRFQNTFEDCKNLTGSIPEYLFANNTKVETFYATFCGCSGLTGNIPSNLFVNNTKVNTFDSTFKNCNSLTGNIPENLFTNNADVTIFESTFQGCNSLTGSIPENLFANNTEVTSFQSTFAGCQGLSGNIPENLFANNTEVTTFNTTFRTCSNITGNIPENLFANNTEVTSFVRTFYGCSGLTGSVPANLFANNTKVEIFGDEENNTTGTFAYCTCLTSVPQGLFVNNTAMTATNGVFKGCTGLTSAYVDSKIVGNEMYAGCNNLTSITVANNVTSIGNQAFNYTGSTPPLNTYLTTENNLARNYNWATDNRAIVVGVSFNNNGGTGEMANQTFTSGVAQALTTNTFTRTGYTFTGWNTAADGTGTSYTDGQSITITDSIALYAQWTANTYTVKYNGNGATGGSTADSTHTYNEAKNLTANGYEKKHTVTYNHQYPDTENNSGNNQSEHQLKVGDYINYTLKTPTTEELAQLNSDIATYSGASAESSGGGTANEQKTAVEGNTLLCRVLEIDETTGNPTKLISADGVNSLRLYGANGYNNAVYLINEMCETLYSGKYGTTKSLTIEDLENNYFNPTALATAKGSTYGNKKRYTGNYSKYPLLATKEKRMGINTATETVEGNTYNILNTSDTALDLSEQKRSDLESGKSTTTNAARGITVTQTYYKIKQGNDNYNSSVLNNIFHQSPTSNDINSANVSSYWLASRCVITTSSHCEFYVRRVVSDYVREGNMFTSEGREFANSYAVRPVITLNPGTKVEYVEAYNSTYNTWTFKEKTETREATSTFESWNSEGNGTGTSYANNASVTNLSSTQGATVNLYAQWTGGSINNLPTREGYTFGGWYETRDCSGTRVDNNGEYTPTEDITLYAKWTADTHTVTINPGTEGTLPGKNKGQTDTIEVTYDSTYGTLPIPTRLGYDFEGWFTAAEGGDQITGDTQVAITADQTLYAHWTAGTYTVTLNPGSEGTLPNKNKGETDTINATYDSTYGTLPQPTRPGYTFEGWFTAQDGGGQVTAETTVAITENQTLHAHWTANKYNVTLDDNYNIFNIDNNTFENLSIEYDKETSILTLNGTSPSNNFPVLNIIDNFTFTEGERYDFNLTHISGTITGEGIVGMVADVTDEDGIAINPRKNTRRNLFPTLNEGFGRTIDADAAVQGKKLRIGIWMETKTNPYVFNNYKVRVELNRTLTKELTYDSTYGTLPAMTRKGYELAGWYTALDGGDQVTAESQVKITENQTLYAHWTAKTYTVTLNPGAEGTLPNKNKGETDTINATYDATYGTLPVPTRTGYTFAGWFTEETGGTQITESTTVTITGVQTLYAHWNGEEYEITLNNQSATSAGTPSIYETYEEKYSLTSGGQAMTTSSNAITKPQRTGYEFGGYYIDRNGVGTQVIDENGFITVGATAKEFSSNGTLYAKWTDSTAPSLVLTKETYQEGFEDWELLGGAYIDNNGALILQNSESTAMSRFYQAEELWHPGFDAYATNAAPSYTPDGGVSFESYYYDDTLAATQNPNGLTSNGWASQINLNEWNDTTDALLVSAQGKGTNIYGNNIKYVRIKFRESQSSSTYPIKIKKFKMYGQLWGATYDIKINAEDNESGVKTIKFADGDRNVEYFATNGTEVTGDKVTVNNNGTYTVYVEDKAGNKIVQTIVINQIDTSAPSNTAPTFTNTANSITVTNNQVDNESGIFKVEYAIKESGGEYGNWQSSNEFTGLRSSTTYNIKTRTINKANLKTESEEVTVTTDTIQYTITLDNQEADTAGTETIYEIFENRYSLTSGGQAMTPSTNQITKPEKTGSLFTGYYTGQNGTGTQVIDANGYISAGASNTLFTSDSTIYANWSTGSWLVTFDATGGTSSEPTRAVTYDAAVGTLPTADYVNHIFDGWYTAASGGTKITESTAVRGNVTYYAHWKDAIAEINGTYYISLAKAIEAVTTSDETTIRLVNDTSEKIKIENGRNIIFDFGTSTLRNNGANPVIENYGNLTFIGGNITTSANQGAINNKSGARLRITGGSITATGDRQTIYNEGGTTEIYGGYFSAKAAVASGNNRSTVQNKSGTMIITGGTIETAEGATNAIAVTNSGTMTIGIKDGQINQSSPVITGAKYGINNEAAIKLYDGNIRGGTGSGKGALSNYASNKISDKEAGYGIDHETVDSYDHVIYVSAHTVTFNVNASDGQLDEELRKKTIQEGNQIGELPIPTRAGYTFLGWFDTSAATGGTQITAEDYIGNDDVTYYARWEKTPPAEINGQTYTTLQAAIDTCQAGGTVEIDVVADTNEEISIPSGKDITINLNGYTVSNNGKKGIIKNKGSLTINGGDIDSKRAGFSAIDNDPGATLILDSVNIIAEGNPEENSTENRQTVYNKGGTVKIRGNTYLESKASGETGGVPRSTINNLNDGSNIGTLTIESGTIVHKNTELANNKNACITNASGAILIIGNKEGLYNQESPTIIGKKYGIYNAGTAKFYDGTINGLLGTIAGTVTTFAEIEDYHNQDAGTKQFEIDEVTETYNSIYLIRPIAFTPSTEEMTSGPITVTITYNSQIVSGQKAGYGTTPEEAMANATEGTANSVTVTANGYVYAEGLTSGGEPVSATVEISNISN